MKESALTIALIVCSLLAIIIVPGYALPVFFVMVVIGFINIGFKVHKDTHTPFPEEDEAIRLARQEVAEIEWLAGLIEMPGHLKPAPREETKSTEPLILRGSRKDLERYVARNALGDVVYDTHGTPVGVSPAPLGYELHPSNVPESAQTWLSGQEPPITFGKYHYVERGRPCEICEKELANVTAWGYPENQTLLKTLQNRTRWS